MKQLLFLLILQFITLINLHSVSFESLNEAMQNTPNPFPYDLHMQMLPGIYTDEEVLICLHGMGCDYTIGNTMRANPALPYHIISFNFPDYGKSYNDHNYLKSTFGTIDEILPALYVWKCVVVNGKASCAHLYGFSAGGGVIINMLAVLCSHRYDAELAKIGIGDAEKNQMLASIPKGSLILEAPLKSFEEIADRDGGAQMNGWARRARENGMKPIDNLTSLGSLSADYFVCFASCDAAIGNRDDQKFIERLRLTNTQGQVNAIISKSKGHTAYHPELWQTYKDYVIKKRSGH